MRQIATTRKYRKDWELAKRSKPDWLLIYRKTDNNELQILELVRTGTHSDLFKIALLLKREGLLYMRRSAADSGYAALLSGC